jgi:acetyl-CoA carboxylase biotin carboxyl carrier protein
VNKKEVEEYIGIFEKSDISELEIHFMFGRKLIIRKHTAAQQYQQPVQFVTPQEIHSQPADPNNSQTAAQQQVEIKKVEKVYLQIKAPMVGTFYRRPNPNAQPYIQAGDRVETGQPVCIIEAMKLFNEVKSEFNGKIVDVLVEDAQAVEYGQILFTVEP